MYYYGGRKMKEIVCIVCPNGCLLQVEKVENKFMVSGNMCQRGIQFGIDEMTNPQRSICSTVRTSFHNMPRVSVRTDGEVPLSLISRVMGEINKVYLTHKVHSEDIIIKDVLGTGVNVIATSDMYYILREGII